MSDFYVVAAIGVIGVAFAVVSIIVDGWLSVCVSVTSLCCVWCCVPSSASLSSVPASTIPAALTG